MAASVTTWVIRPARVVSRAALTIHHNICFRALGGNPTQLLRACGSRSSAAFRSDGSSRSSTWSAIVHQPLAFAAAMARRPASVMRPRASISAARSRLSRVHELLGLRGVKSCRLRSSSRMVLVESIQPKQMASSTASGYGQRGRPVVLRQEHNHTPRADARLCASQARHCSLVSAWMIGYSNFHVGGWAETGGSDSEAVTYPPVVN